MENKELNLIYYIKLAFARASTKWNPMNLAATARIGQKEDGKFHWTINFILFSCEKENSFSHYFPSAGWRILIRFLGLDFKVDEAWWCEGIHL